MKLVKRITSIILVACILLSTSFVAMAKDEEEYLNDLRIVYADSYEEAKKILQNTEFKKYN